MDSRVEYYNNNEMTSTECDFNFENEMNSTLANKKINT